MKRYKTVNEFMNDQDLWKGLLTELRNILLDTELEETVKWGFPVYTINNKNVVGLGSFKSYAGLWFYNGALLKDQYKVLINAQEGRTKAMRQWRFTDITEVNKTYILEYIREAIDNQKKGRVIRAEKKPDLEIPEMLKKRLADNIDLDRAFAGLSPYKKREYTEYISEAKREETRSRRLEKSIPMILKGIGLNDKYRDC